MKLAGSSHTRHRGFTLVELLVVVAIIALLIGVLLPALAGARKSSQRVASAGNLRQIAIYNNLYAEDFKDWFPVVYSPTMSDTSALTSLPPGGARAVRNPPPEWVAQVQGSYGGYAGFFSLNQKNGQGSVKSAYKKDVAYYWDGARWVIESEKGKRRPIMERYMEGPGSYAVLQNPADTADGGENGADFPLTAPQKIKDEYDVVWHNISYLYIAGLKRTDASLCFVGDESNAVDWGNNQGIAFQNYYGTMRYGHPDPKKRGLQEVDNHGDTGGNYAYSDGHVEWITASRTDLGTGEKIYPHDKIFPEITTFLKKRGDSTAAVQTID